MIAKDYIKQLRQAKLEGKHKTREMLERKYGNQEVTLQELGEFEDEYTYGLMDNLIKLEEKQNLLMSLLMDIISKNELELTEKMTRDLEKIVEDYEGEDVDE